MAGFHVCLCYVPHIPGLFKVNSNRSFFAKILCSNVKAEVRHQVRRLANHPSIALWAGNNENELALMTNWYGTHNNLTLYKSDYIKLYIDTIQAELLNLTNVIFVSSSPSNGKESIQEDYLATNPGNPLFGDGIDFSSQYSQFFFK